MKKILLISLMLIGVNSFAAITEQDKLNFKSIYGNELPAKLSAKLFEFCEKNDMDIDTALSKMKASPALQSMAPNGVKGKLCCVNVNGFLGEYAFIQGQGYCIPPC